MLSNGLEASMRYAVSVSASLPPALLYRKPRSVSSMPCRGCYRVTCSLRIRQRYQNRTRTQTILKVTLGSCSVRLFIQHKHIMLYKREPERAGSNGPKTDHLKR